jgi:hypothetical protein
MNPYSQYNNYNYYYIRPNYEEYYKDSNILSTNYYNSYDLAAEFDPTDWMPFYDSFFDAKNYILSLDENKVKEIKLFVQCSDLFCILVINNFNDDLKYDKNKNRIYIDVIMRNFAFIDNDGILVTGGNKEYEKLKMKPKICLIENLFINNEKNNHNHQFGK